MGGVCAHGDEEEGVRGGELSLWMGWGGRAHGDGVGGVGRRLSPWLGWGGCTGGGPGAGALGTKEPSSPSRGCVPTGRGSLGPPGDPIAGLTAALGSETWGLSRVVSGEGSRSHLPPIPVPVATALLLLPLPQHLLQAVLQRLCLARTDPLPSALHSGGLPPIGCPPFSFPPQGSPPAARTGRAARWSSAGSSPGR